MSTRKERAVRDGGWPCPICKGRGAITEYLREFYHNAGASRALKKYCNTCLLRNHCPVCGGAPSRDENAKRFRVCPTCGHDVERVGEFTERTKFEKAGGAQRLTSVTAPIGGLIVRYLTSNGLIIEFKAFGRWLKYRRSYWQRQALVEATEAMIEAFDEERHRELAPSLPEGLFEELRASVHDLSKLSRAAAAVAQAYQAMPYDQPFGRGLIIGHFERLRDALAPSAQQITNEVNPPSVTADANE